MPVAPAAAAPHLQYKPTIRIHLNLGISIKTVSLLLFLSLSLHNKVRAQQNADTSAGAAVNQYDEKGLKNGFWYIEKPATKGESSKSYFGVFYHGKKNGLWYASDYKGDIVSIETYRNDVKDGEAKYFDNGRMTSTGTYRGLNPIEKLDTFIVVMPQTGEERTMVVPTERGSVRHGNWRFYNETNGRLIREEYYQADELIYRKEFNLSTEDSLQYRQWEESLPHKDNTREPRSKFKPKAPTRSLIE